MKIGGKRGRGQHPDLVVNQPGWTATARAGRPGEDSGAAPSTAYIDLESGLRIGCRVTEDPQLTDGGYRRFWLDPVIPFDPGDGIRHVHLDRLPVRSKATVRPWYTDKG